MNKQQEQFTIVYVDDVKQYGLIRATILGKIKGWCDTNKKGKRYYFDGFYWSGHISLNEIVKQTGLPLETIKKNLKWLIDNNVIIKSNYNKIKIDRTGWYRPNPLVLIDPVHCSCEEHTIVPERNNGKVLRGTMDSPDRNNGKFLRGTMESSCEEQTIPNIPSNIPTNIPSNIQKPNNTTTITTNIPDWQTKTLIEVIKEKILDENLQFNLLEFICGSDLTRLQKDLIIKNVPQLKEKIPALETYFKNLN